MILLAKAQAVFVFTVVFSGEIDAFFINLLLADWLQHFCEANGLHCLIQMVPE